MSVSCRMIYVIWEDSTMSDEVLKRIRGEKCVKYELIAWNTHMITWKNKLHR